MGTDLGLVKVSSSNVGEEELAAVARVFDSGYLGMGSEVASFESELSEYLGRSTVCVSTGTSALQLALQGMGIGPGDEVIVPTFTYVATFQAISATGAIPIACDVDPTFLTMAPEFVEPLITPKTRALLPVHFAGYLHHHQELLDLAAVHKLRVVEDAAHSFGTRTIVGQVGNVGDVVCFSFDPIKNITSGEGGAVVSSDESVLGAVRDARLLGVEGDSAARIAETRLYDFDVKEQGWRYHMSNICAAIGRVQLKRFPDFAAKRQVLAQAYSEGFASNESVELIPMDYQGVVPHIFTIRLPSEKIRDDVRGMLREKLNVTTAVHYLPNHLLTKYSANSVSAPNAESAYRRIVSLPLHPGVSPDEVVSITAAINSFVQE